MGVSVVLTLLNNFGEVITFKEGRVAQGVTAHDLEVLDAVEEQVHAGDGRSGEVFLLAEEFSPQALRIAMLVLHVLDCRQKHATRTAGGVVDRFALFGVEHVDHHPHDAAGGVKLASLLVGGVGELLDQVFVGVTQHITADCLIAHRQTGKVLDQVFEQGIRVPVLVGPLRIAKYTVERIWVGLFDLAHSTLQGIADIGSDRTDIVPMAFVGDLETVRFREQGQFGITRISHDLLILVVPYIADALEEK